MDLPGIEPGSHDCQPHVIPVYHRPLNIFDNNNAYIFNCGKEDMGFRNFEEYESRRTIDFPHPINSEETVRLLEYVADKCGYESLHYGMETIGSIRRTGEPKNERYIKGIEGTIWGSGMEHAIFNLERELNPETPEGMFKGITFSSLGLDFDEVPYEEVKIWRDVRRYVQEYFKLQEQDDSFNEGY